MNNDWLALTEYSSKYHVSVSTLRRRIRSGQAVHVYKNGKYLLKDLPLVDHQMMEKQSAKQTMSSEESMIQREAIVAPPRPPHKKFLAAQAEQKNAWAPQNSKNNAASKEVETLLAELKSAYRQVLQEKEEQVLILKNEISDLRTLVTVLESENKRLQR